MLVLRAVPHSIVQHLFVDFQKKSKCFELPPDNAEFIGIYLEAELVGYFALVDYQDGDIEINQGYLRDIARHRALSYESMKILQTELKRLGFKKIILKASRSLKAYSKFMGNLGFRSESIIFSKGI